MRETLLTIFDDSLVRGGQTAVANWRGLRVSCWSYARLAACAFRFARELEAGGIGRGDRVLFWGENSPEWVAAFFGCLLRGAVVVPLDLHSSPDFATRVQQQVSAKLLLATGGESALKIPRLSLEELPDTVSHHSDEPYPPDNVHTDDLIEIIFTSGTTGEPKGVRLTHRNLLANLIPVENELEKYARWERLVHPLRFFCLLPLSHVFGQLMGIFIPSLLGGEVYFPQSLNPSEILDLSRRQRINVIATVPRVLETLRDKFQREAAARGESKNFSTQLAAAERRHFLRNWWTFRRIHHLFGWRCWAFITGGATLGPDTETFWKRLGFAVIQGYGMTETASLISLSHPFQLVRGSIGRVVPGQEIKLDKSGEILVRGQNVSPGYWENASGSMIDEQGWLRTGDLGQMDTAGNIYFRGRSKDTIVTAAGLKIYPTDLEAALDRQPEIKAAAVLPITGPNGPEPLAVLIAAGDAADLQSAVMRANQSLADFQQIRRWITWPESDFPRTTATRKVIKALVAGAVKQMIGGPDSKTIRQTARPASASEFTALISQLAGNKSEPLTSQSTLSADLKLDSLGRVELLSALEDRYEIELDETAFTAATTVGEIERMVHEGKAEAVPYPYPEWALWSPVTWIRLAIYHGLILPITLILGWVRVRGAEHLDDVQGPALFISNHITFVDPALIMSALTSRWRNRLTIAMLGEHLRDWLHPPAGTNWFTRLRMKVEYLLVVALFGVFPLPQKTGFRRSFAYAGAAMDRGWNVLVFPEGQRTEDGRLNPFMSGTGLLVAGLHAPVIPIRIDGLFELKQQGRHFARPGAVTVTFGEPVKFSRQATAAEIIRDLESRMASL